MTVNSESRSGTPVTLVLIHTNEGDNKPDDVGNDHTAEALAAYCDRECTAGRGKSYHKITDDDSTVTTVPDDRAAWSAKGANKRGLNLCFTGWSHWSQTDWLHHGTMLDRGAAEVRTWGALYDIPLRKVNGAQIRAGLKGIGGHGDWSDSNLDDSDHTDPGPNFPWDIFIAKINGSARIVSTQPYQTEADTVQLPRTSPGEGVKPGTAWPVVEESIAHPPASGSAHVVFGYRGAIVREAWWGPSGSHIVDAERPLGIDQFKMQRWDPPPGAEWITIRYAAPSGGSIGFW